MSAEQAWFAEIACSLSGLCGNVVWQECALCLVLCIVCTVAVIEIGTVAAGCPEPDV